MSKQSILATAAVTIVLGALFALVCWMVYSLGFAPCKPCGYVNYDKKIEDGYESSICLPCSSAADPASWMGRHMTHARALAGCPPIYKTMYNKKVDELNSQLVRKGFPPRFETIK